MRKISDSRIGRQSHSSNRVNGNTLTPEVRTALSVARTYPVFPCDPISKRPLTEHGFKEATQDEGRITRWWSQYPDALVGVPTGKASGLVAIDVDPDGRSWYQGHRARLGAHRLHQTRRGKHLLYRMNGVAIKNSAGQVAPGVDVRGEGGYIVWWAAHGGVAIGEPGELPGWLERAAGSPENAPGDSSHGVPERWPNEIRDGGRNDWLSKRAYSLSRAGWGEEKILETLRALNKEKCRPPLPERELQTIARGKRKFAEEDAAQVVLLRADEQEEKAVEWLWKGFLARNKLHLLAGAGGSLKSTLTLNLAATVSTGGRWPDGSRCPKGSVIIWTGEDDLADTVKPRLRFAGADLTRCYFVDGVRRKDDEPRAFDPSQDMAGLAQACEKLRDVALIIVDPAISVVRRDSNSAAEVRRGLDPLIALGMKHGAAIVGIHHFNKGSKGKNPIDRITGSGAWSQAPRVSWVVAAVDAGDGQVPNRWVFCCDKIWGKARGGGYEYTYEEEPKTEIVRVIWGRRLEGTAQSILAEAEGTEEGGSKLGEAKQLLRKLLANGSMSNWDIAKKAEDAGIRGITLKRAREALGIKPVRVGKNQFRWRLPDEDDTNSNISNANED